jgi:cytosine/adenosine deaminase-related metal-dependent hydrolase
VFALLRRDRQTRALKGTKDLVLRNARAHDDGRRLDLRLAGGLVREVGAAGSLDGSVVVDLEERTLLPGLVNAHDHLDFSTFPFLGRPPYASVYDWSADVNAGAGDARAAAALAVPLADRLFLGGLRNLRAGVTAVAHHGPFHRSLAREDIPTWVLERYQFAHSPGLTPQLKRTYRSTDRRIPWMVHAAEGTDARCRAEVKELARQRLLRHNAVLVHAIGVDEDDLAGIAAAGACAVWCPESNRHLYGATADVRALRAAGIRVGLGSDSPVSGVRDALSNLAAAHREGAYGTTELIELATRGSADTARLPVGGLDVGARADLLAVTSLDALVSGDRTAVELVVREGRPVYGTPALAGSVLPGGDALAVDGQPRRLARGLGRRAASIVKAHPRARGAGWMAGLELGSFD